MTVALDDTRVAPLAGADGLPQSLAPLQALVSSSAEDDDCVLWSGLIDTDGYGRIYLWTERGHIRVRAHRHIWEECIGPIRDGDVVHHKCRNRLCVNPNHLEAMTRVQHARLHALCGVGAPHASGWLERRTHCKNGHEFTPENTRSREGRIRVCRACQRDYGRRKRLASLKSSRSLA